jgi:sugar lactone lactonase YvrE
MTTTRRFARARTALASAFVLSLTIAGGLVTAARPDAALAQEASPVANLMDDGARLFALPGDAVYPEGVAYQPETGAFFAGSAADGTIFRGDVASGTVEVFSPAGADGRTSAVGMKVDLDGRLFVAGGSSGGVWVYDTATGALLTQASNGLEPNTFLNDIALTEDGDAYVTDSFFPILFRLAATALPGDTLSATPGAAGTPATPTQLEAAIDLSGSVVPFNEGFNLNGIVAAPGGQVLLVVHSSTGGLYRVDLGSQEVTQVDLGDATLANGDGMALQDGTLYVVRNADGVIVPVTMADDFTSGDAGEGFSHPGLAFPTTIAPYDGCLLVVNSQFNAREGGEPVLPFTVAGIPIPLSILPEGTPATGASATTGGC